MPRPTRRPGPRPAPSLPFLLILAAAAAPAARPAAAQEGLADAAGGALLGAFSGAALGLVASLEPCNRTLLGARCARTSTLLGAAVGGVSGGVVGWGSESQLSDRVRGAGVGGLAGAGVGLALAWGVRQYGWRDVAAASALGAAVGAAPVGAGLGFAAGAVAGGIAWAAVPGAGLHDAVLLSLGGAAVGGLVDWIAGAARADRPEPVLALQLRTPFE